MDHAKETSKSPDRLNPEMLVLARDFAGFTQTDLAEKLNVSQGTISKIEEGLMECDEAFIIALQDIFGRPKSFFTQIPGHPLSLEGSFRRKSSMTKKLLRTADARMNIERIQINKLVESCSLEIEDPPFCHPDEHLKGPSEIARLIRAHYNVPPGPLENVVELVERAGCFVRFMDFGTLSIDGFAVLSGVNTPIIFVNKAFPADRRRLTLAHEFGHVIMHRGLVRPNGEDEAFEFAGELLMPASQIKSSLYPLNIEKLARLKLRWKVSMGAILQHAKRIGAVNDRYYRYMRSQLSKNGYTREEPYEETVPLEKPDLLTKIFRYYKNDLDYGINEMCALLASNEFEVKSLNRPNHERLTVL